MERKSIQRKIVSLVQLDMDAVHAYHQAIIKIAHLEVRERLELFQQDHERHVRELSARLSEIGGEIPEEPDLKGYLIEGFMTIRSSTGIRGALKAMYVTERLINHGYQEALKENFPTDLLSLIEGYREEEKRHLRYIEEAIAEKVWEQPARRMIMHDQLFDTLKKDHGEVRKIFTRIQETESGSERKNLVETLRKEILPHMIGEEKIVYASLKEQKEAWSEALEGIEEHHAAQIILQELVHTPPEDERFRAKVSVLKEMVEHHIREEEKNIFEYLRKVLSEKRAKEVLDGFNREKEMAQANYPDIPFVTVPPPEIRA